MSVSSRLPADTSLRAAQALHLGTHSVSFYEEDSFLLDSLTKLIGTTLIAGDVAVVVATAAHRDRLAKRLKAQGLDLEVTARLGRYFAVDAAETLSSIMVNGALDTALFNAFIRDFLSSVRSAAKGYSPRLVIFGEMVAVLCSQGNFDAALKLEQLWNDLARTELLPSALRLSDDVLRS